MTFREHLRTKQRPFSDVRGERKQVPPLCDSDFAAALLTQCFHFFTDIFAIALLIFNKPACA